MASWRSGLLASAVGVLVAGCGGTGDDTVACTTEVRYSVVVSVVDSGGQAVPGATVSYSVDGGSTLAATCIGLPSACSNFLAGQEISGEFAIKAGKAGWRPASATVTVQRDACHVITREVVMTLEPA